MGNKSKNQKKGGGPRDRVVVASSDAGFGMAMRDAQLKKAAEKAERQKKRAERRAECAPGPQHSKEKECARRLKQRGA